jgi:ribosomal protein L11 methyltransferase
MLELFPEGFEESVTGETLELVAYTDAVGEEHIRRKLGSPRVEPSSSGWEEAWKRHHRPVRVGPLWVGPPWEDPDPGAIPVVIEPGQAFGTGAHPTTRLCLEELVVNGGGSLLDVGCGSGVLAVAGAKLGFVPVTAVDHDPVAVETTRSNLAANGAEAAVRLLDGVREPLPDATLTVANIDLAAVDEVARRARSEILVLSGYLDSAEPSAPGWRRLGRRVASGWAADTFEPS